tara:strand:- start:25 stop:426 length:402 start_codon:yes stop_codon:yes gene_type:complete
MIPQQASLCALFSVFELAREPGRQVSAAEIADKYGLSINHLAKVLRELTRARIIKSVRGAGGGYTFVANSRHLTLYDIIGHFEEISSDPKEDVNPSDSTDAGRALNRVLSEIDGITVSTLKSISVATFLKLSC